jgi:hypothetical protein
VLAIYSIWCAVLSYSAEFGIINQSSNQSKAPFNLIINSHQILGNQGFTYLS